MVVSIDQIRIQLSLAIWHYTHSQEFLLNMEVFVDLASQAKLVTYTSLMFLKCYSLHVGRLKIVVQGDVNYHFSGPPSQKG